MVEAVRIARPSAERTCWPVEVREGFEPKKCLEELLRLLRAGFHVSADDGLVHGVPAPL